MIPLPCGGSPTQGGGWGVGSRSTTESGNAESDGKTTESDPGYCTVTGGLPRHRGIEIHITVCVGVWFCGLEPLLGRWGGGLVTVCGRVCWVLGDIYINVYLLGCWRPKIVLVFAPPTVRSLGSRSP